MCVCGLVVYVFHAESSNWQEAAMTLADLAMENGLSINRTVSFNEPYVGLDGMPNLVKSTYEYTRSTL